MRGREVLSKHWADLWALSPLLLYGLISCSCNINAKIICNGTDKVLEYVHTCSRQYCWGGRRWGGTGQMVMSQPSISASSGHLQASYTLMASLSFILKISDYILINFLFIWNLPGEFCWALGTSKCLIQPLPGQRYLFFFCYSVVSLI